MSAEVKIRKNILPFQYQLKKNMTIIKQLDAKLSLLILVDSNQVNQTLFITYLKLIIKIAKNAWREKISNQNVSLLELKTIDYVWKKM